MAKKKLEVGDLVVYGFDDVDEQYGLDVVRAIDDEEEFPIDLEFCKLAICYNECEVLEKNFI